MNCISSRFAASEARSCRNYRLTRLRARGGPPRGKALVSLSQCLFLHVAQAAFEHAQHREEFADLVAVIALEEALLNDADPLYHCVDRAPAGQCQIEPDLAPILLMKAPLDKALAKKAANRSRHGRLIDCCPARYLDRFDRTPNRDRREHAPFVGVESEMIRINGTDRPVQQ